MRLKCFFPDKKLDIRGGFLKDRRLPEDPLNQLMREIRKDNHSGTFLVLEPTA